MSLDPVVFWEINAVDGENLTRFYQSVFEWGVETDDTGFHSVDSAGDDARSIAGGIFTGKGAIRPHRALYVRVDSVADIVERVRAAGGVVLLEPFEGPSGQTLAFFEDPEGHITGVVERRTKKEGR
jgi:hypothetical protein